MQGAGQPAPPNSVCASVKNSLESKEGVEPVVRRAEWKRWRGDSEAEQKMALGEEGESGYVK